MQGITHFLTGILIEKTGQSIDNRFIRIGTIASVAILSHGLLDRLARLTYHPPDPLWNDWFWLSFHFVVYSGSIIVLVRYWKTYKWGMIFASLPDFDWLIIKPAQLIGIKVNTNLHDIVYAIIDSIPILKETARLPIRNLERAGAIIEILFLILLVWGIYLVDKRKSQ